ncbi:sensor histidine kinase [Rugamonas sp. FT107W]|uniref:histidine kinase n=2 Tax=Duganella vulcania TaxID=2692166 RepID=A0A845HIN2_9BURK|nr:sensor histidine kinase [Duganella vulcania]
MRTRTSLRSKVAAVFSLLTIMLLLAQALGLKALMEVQEEKFINAVIADDLRDLTQAYRSDGAQLPPLDASLGGYVSQEGGLRLTLPASVKSLGPGTHEIILDDREVHVAVTIVDGKRLYRIYDFSIYERHFKQVIDAVLIGTGIIAVLTIWLAFRLSGLLVRQVAGLATQVRSLRVGVAQELIQGPYDEIEVVELVDTFNDYHRRMAQMIEREKEFTGNVSHELRTPLTTVKTSCELLEQDAILSEKSRARVQQIVRATANMEGMVNALLSLAREESAALTAPVALAGSIADSLVDFAGRLAARDIEALIDIDASLRVQVHQPALMIVLSNLIDNAVRHTQAGHMRFAYDGGELVIGDTGSGIPIDEQARVFERFYRAPRSDCDQAGFGIGLAVVKKICDRHHWIIRIESGPAEGTRVFVRLPLAA